MPQLLSTQINSRQQLKSVKKKADLHDYVQNSRGRPSRQTWRDRAPLTPDLREGAHSLGIHHSTQHPGLQKPSINTLIVRAEVNLSAPLAHGLITSWNAGGCGSSEINKSHFCSCRLHQMCLKWICAGGTWAGNTSGHTLVPDWTWWEIGLANGFTF